MKIEPLADNMHFFCDVAKLKFHEFSYLTGDETIESYLERQKTYVRDQLIPKAYVVINQLGSLTGTFTLKLEDLSSRLDLSPWFGSLVVAPKYRKQGIGAYIVNSAVRLAKDLGYSQLYLYTPNHEAWYAKQGWQLIERTLSGKFLVSVMSKAL